jgi:hypothetical protein
MKKMMQYEMKEPILTEQEEIGEEHDHEITEGKNIPIELSKHRICKNVCEQKICGT